MKTYQIQKFSGNQNKWGDDFIVLRTTTIDENIADDFNARFETTGIKYVEVAQAEDKPIDEKIDTSVTQPADLTLKDTENTDSVADEEVK